MIFLIISAFVILGLWSYSGMPSGHAVKNYILDDFRTLESIIIVILIYLILSILFLFIARREKRDDSWILWIPIFGKLVLTYRMIARKFEK